jgi:predicted metalloprotease with PDZ domain
MGSSPSSEASSPQQPPLSEDKHGYHVLHVMESSPSDEAGLEPYFDYLIAINGQSLVRLRASCNTAHYND